MTPFFYHFSATMRVKNVVLLFEVDESISFCTAVHLPVASGVRRIFQWRGGA